MLKEIRFERWKSFEKSVLYIDPLTVLIGANASGKSNALDGMAFLSQVAAGTSIEEALSEDRHAADGQPGAVRGGIEWAAMRPGHQFTLGAIIEYMDRTEYHYEVCVDTSVGAQVLTESLKASVQGRTQRKPLQLFRSAVNDVGGSSQTSPVIDVDLYNGRGRPRRIQLKRTHTVLSQLRAQAFRDEIVKGVECTVDALSSIFILDPDPKAMRGYAPLASRLSRSCGNLAGLLAALPQDQRKAVEQQLSDYASELAGGETRRVWIENVGRFGRDAMLYCEERWPGLADPLIVDARGMSDGTLRFLAILVSLLTRPRGSQIVIEEVDNGLHPSRAGLLLKILERIGAEREIDILVTTHNPALMDELAPELVPFVIVAHRSATTGRSELTPLEDVAVLPKMLASGALGRAITRGMLPEYVVHDGVGDDD